MAVINGQTRTPRRLLRIPEAVAYLNGIIAPKTLRDWVWRRQIAVVRLGRRVCIEEAVLDQLIEKNTLPALENDKGPRKSPRIQTRSTKKGQASV